MSMELNCPGAILRRERGEGEGTNFQRLLMLGMGGGGRRIGDAIAGMEEWGAKIGTWKCF